MERKYPPSLFFTGVLVSMLRHWLLSAPAAFCLIAGIWSRSLRLAGLICLVADLVFSVIEQLVFMNSVLCSDGDSEFDRFRDAMLSENWRENIQELMNDIAADEEDSDDDDDDDDDDYDDFDDGDDSFDDSGDSFDDVFRSDDNDDK